MNVTDSKPSPQLTLYPKSDFLIGLRKGKGLSQSEVEKAAGLKKSRLYHYEKGRPIPLRHMRLLAKFYGVPACSLIDDVSVRTIKLFSKELEEVMSEAA